MTETTINTATINSAALQAHLTSVEDRFDPSRSLTDPPIVVDNPAAIDAMTTNRAIGRPGRNFSPSNRSASAIAATDVVTRLAPPIWPARIPIR